MEERDPLVSHLRHVAGDAAVVTDEAPRVGRSVLDVCVVDERARDLAARGREARREGLAVLAREEAVVEAHVDVVPREARRHGDRAEVLGAVDPEVDERLLPQIELQPLIPRVEARAVLPRALEHVAEGAIAAREDALQHARRRVVRAQRHRAVRPGGVLEDPLLARHLVEAVHRAPLKGRVRLGHVDAHAHSDLGAALRGPLADLHRAHARLDDAANVVVVLGGQADHEVELHLGPPAREHALRRLEELLLGNVLVHDVAHALRSSLRREGEPRRANALDLVEEIRLQAVSAQRRHAERHAILREALRHLLEERRDAGDVGRRERRERHLVLPALLHRGEHRLHDLLGIALAHGPVDHPRLAEAAPLGAAARDLDRHAIEDGLRPPGGAVVGERISVDVDHRALDLKRNPLCEGAHDDLETGVGIDGGLVKGGHVDGSELRERDEPLSPRYALALEPRPCERDLRAHLLAVADHDRVEEDGQRLRVRRRRAARDHERIVLAAIRRAERDAAEVHHREDVAVRELVLEREADDGEVAQRPGRLDGDEREAARRELRLHVDPRRIAALRERARVVVEDFVEDLEAEVAHPDVVDIRESEADGGLDGGPVLCARAYLAARIARRLLDPVEELRVGVIREERRAFHVAAGSTARARILGLFPGTGPKTWSRRHKREPAGRARAGRPVESGAREPLCQRC